MIFTFRKWDAFCRKLQENGKRSIPACAVTSTLSHYLVLKHDVETNVPNAYRMAQIEHTYGHKGSYYVQAYLLDSPENVALLQKMQDMGHEVSYHYDVMDSCKGDLEKAILEFEANRKRFTDAGLPVCTVCQHGNPVIERVGYHSNRDFFRSSEVQNRYPDISDIMVNFQSQRQTSYRYFSDAGRKFKQIFDPINNDIVNSDDKNTPYDDLDALLKDLSADSGNIVSTHPHRWTKSALLYVLKDGAFKGIKTAAKILVKIPVFKKIMSRYYYLAKKI